MLPERWPFTEILGNRRIAMQLTEEQLAQFDEEGYLFLPEVFSRKETAVLMIEVPGIFAQEPQENFREQSGVVRTTFAAHTFNETFRRLCRHPRLNAPVMTLLAGPV